MATTKVTQSLIADDSVGADQLAANAVVNASIASGAAIDMDKLDGDSLASAITDFAQDDLVILSDTSDSGNLVKMTTSNFEDAIFGNISGDVTLAAGGAATAASAQTNIASVLNTSLIVGRDGDNQIKFSTDNQIIFEVDGGDNVIFKTSGEIEASSLDISGDVDVDGTLEADAITINGTTLAETIADTVGAMVTSNTETGIAVTYEDGDNTLDFVLGTITSLGTVSTGVWQGTAIDTAYIDTTLTSQTSILNTSLVVGRDADNQIKFGTDNQIIFEVDGGDNVIFKTSGEIEASSLDISGDADIDGTLEADAITIGGVTLAETIADTVGAMVGSNTETGIAVTYEDGDNTLDFVIGAGAIANSMLADDAVGADELAANAVVNASIASGAAIDMDKLDGDSLATAITDFAQDDLVILSDTSDSGNLVKITTSNFEDAIFGNISGDATVAAGGALTIANDAVEASMLADEFTAAQAVTSASSITLDGGAYDVFTWTSGHSTTLAFTNITLGMTKSIIIIGSGGSNTVAFGNINGSSGTFNLISGTYSDAAVKNLIQLKFISTSECWYTISQISS